MGKYGGSKYGKNKYGDTPNIVTRFTERTVQITRKIQRTVSGGIQ